MVGRVLFITVLFIFLAPLTFAGFAVPLTAGNIILGGGLLYALCIGACFVPDSMRTVIPALAVCAVKMREATLEIFGGGATRPPRH